MLGAVQALLDFRYMRVLLVKLRFFFTLSLALTLAFSVFLPFPALFQTWKLLSKYRYEIVVDYCCERVSDLMKCWEPNEEKLLLADGDLEFVFIMTNFVDWWSWWRADRSCHAFRKSLLQPATYPGLSYRSLAVSQGSPTLWSERRSRWAGIRVDSRGPEDPVNESRTFETLRQGCIHSPILGWWERP